MFLAQYLYVSINPQMYRGGGPDVFLSFFLDDKTSGPQVFCSFVYISRAFWDRLSDGQLL